jgi:colanic acid biosynthesis glycosyl transferase WcaI
VITLLYSGNFGLGHELDTILHAVHTLRDDGMWKLLLVGAGKGLVAIRGLVAELQLEDVEFRPPVPLDRLQDLLAEGDVHVVTQKPRTEGLVVPSKIYSILCVGKPTIFVGPRNCEVARIVEESESGFVVEPGDVDAAVDALRQLAFDPELRRQMGERAREHYCTHFGRDKSVSRIVQLIERMEGNGLGHGSPPEPGPAAGAEAPGDSSPTSRRNRNGR